ncbi:mevalonate kinase [Methanohalophilus levihalophilus]|uniref:mevalonate kinase n=1 Tax=Methanohalophilus levihalophilus TaxID=1431282 RepID=UPI001AE164EF|nr:mevalonate kinase [Methanohalophilus levihalophilus]MBP2031146.1 mevalonate kinase [Methanohalophilus levihalophilus]
MVTCSAPGKVYLFGEHAVVYGENAICCAVDIRTHITVEENDSVLIESPLGTTGIDYSVHPYVSEVLEKVRAMSPFEGIKVHVESDIPIGSGLGSSAAVTVATLKGLDNLLGLDLSLEEIASIGHEIEIQVQGAASPTDTYVCTMGGTVMIPDRKHLDLLDCGVVIGNTNVFSSTKELVSNVSALKDAYPELISPIFSTIGNTAIRGETLLAVKDYKEVGKLMNVNQGLLDSIGVNCPELSSLIYAARNAGAFGAKITGAGGGGCMVAIAPEDKVEDVSQAISEAGGVSLITKFTGQGVRIE